MLVKENLPVVGSFWTVYSELPCSKTQTVYIVVHISWCNLLSPQFEVKTRLTSSQLRVRLLSTQKKNHLGSDKSDLGASLPLTGRERIISG
ncbi:hypothetical protein CEXT_104941 [Caerostris extrusa]|uniref:Uncharacterized protein n=1 Tax=Caerostris extrusa TaxID=172846 RepID=A0AAV4XVY3_CAEEX|nr:hypothetical protein CEXT_104941 [Caerostris extrusa]